MTDQTDVDFIRNQVDVANYNITEWVKVMKSKDDAMSHIEKGRKNALSIIEELRDIEVKRLNSSVKKAENEIKGKFGGRSRRNSKSNKRTMRKR